MTRLEAFLKTKPWLTVEGGPIGTARVTSTCTNKCGESTTLELPMRGLTAWADGEYVQNAFPQLSVDHREQLISGTCPTCWTKLFGDEE